MKTGENVRRRRMGGRFCYGLNKTALLIVFGGLLAANPCFGDPHVLERKPDTQPFVLLKEGDENGEESFRITLEDNATVLIGSRYQTSVGGTPAKMGVNPETIQVFKLAGMPDLLHIQWNDYMQGNGCFQSLFYEIHLASDPSVLLLKDHICTHGNGGCGTGVSGSYSMQYEGSNLCVRVERGYRNHAYEQKPLYHRVIIKERQPDVFLCTINTTLTRVFSMDHGELELKSTLLEYTAQDGDSLDEICKGLRVEPEWICNVRFFDKKASTVQIELPNAVSAERYPLVDTGEPY
ncbi:MAG: hypothetical protein PF495_14075 [Spirochaetales bacterium]|jgi:hypothetical protein|nr:hypothetical protein [Spirochaetales bacterium]